MKKKFYRDDWLISDDLLKKQAKHSWVFIVLGVALEVLLYYSVYRLTTICWRYGDVVGGGFNGFILGVLGLNCGMLLRTFDCIVSVDSWSDASPREDFGRFKLRILTQFGPWVLLSWRRKVWVNSFLMRLSEGDQSKIINLANEQYQYYLNGASLKESDLRGLRREMACWASAVNECLYFWTKKVEEEKMKSKEHREEMLYHVGIRKGELSMTMSTLEKMEIDSEIKAVNIKGGQEKKRL